MVIVINTGGMYVILVHITGHLVMVSLINTELDGIVTALNHILTEIHLWLSEKMQLKSKLTRSSLTPGNTPYTVFQDNIFRAL